MTLTVLSDDQIRDLLDNLSPDELVGFMNALGNALYEFSTNKSSTAQQPERISVDNAAVGTTTLFMPSCNSTGNSVKVITLTSPSSGVITTTGTSSSTTTPATPQPQAQQHPTIPPTGATLLLSPTGSPLGLLHARTLTAFRTALASLSLVLLRLGQQDIIAANPESKGGTWSYNPKRTIRAVVFGTGEQAYWHARLLLLARGPVIHTVRFVGRSAAAEAGIIARFERLFREGYAEREGWNGCYVRKFGTGVLGTWKGNEGRDGYLDMVLREADVVFCCTPATEPLFDASAVWRRGAAGEKGRLVVAIGSYKPEMREIPAGWVRRVVDEGLVIVDTVEGASVEAGELIEAGVMKEQLVELGTLLKPKLNHFQRRLHEPWSGFSDCLAQGNVIYKSVGVGLMDLSVGMHLVEFAKQKGVGTHIPGF